MAFKLKSGNKPSFKNMGSSPNSMRMTQDPRVNMGDRGMMTGNMKDKTMSTNYKDPYADALKNDPKLPEYIKKRKTLEKGSAEWNANQNKINKAYGKGPMRDQKVETKENDRKTVTVTDTPGVSTVTEKKKDNKEKKTTVDHIEGTVTTEKTKAGPDKQMGTDDDKKKTKKRKKFAETKFGKSKVGQVFVSKKNKKGGMNSTQPNA